MPRDKIRYCLVLEPLSYFPQLLDEPERPGLYNWPKCFGGEVRKMTDIAPDQYEDFDILHVNLTGSGQQIPTTIRNLLPKSTSTKLVLDLDYPPDSPSFQAAFPSLGQFVKAVWAADYVFATEPFSFALLNYLVRNAKELASAGVEPRPKSVALIPHPCPTHSIKKFCVPDEERLDQICVHYHRYDKHYDIPAMVVYNLKHRTGITVPTMLMGFTEAQMATGAFDFQHSYGDWLKYVYMLSHATLAFDYITIHSHSRFVEETACLKIPAVCTNFAYSGTVLFPETCYNPWDFDGMRASLKKLLGDDEFYERVRNHAFEKIEDLNYENSRRKFLEMVEWSG